MGQRYGAEGSRGVRSTCGQTSFTREGCNARFTVAAFEE